MTSAMIKNQKATRFLRDTVPYLINLDNIVTRLEAEEKLQKISKYAFLELIQDAYDNLADCRETLRIAETLVEEARENQSAAEEIEKLVSLCKKLQIKQTEMADSIRKCALRMINSFS